MSDAMTRGTGITGPDAGTAPLISLRDVTVVLQGRSVLSDISLDMRPGEILTLIGPNGAGKTTLIKVALGLIAPQHGDVGRRPGLKTGYVPQAVAIDPVLPLTVKRFLTLAVKVPAAEVAAALERVGVADLAESPVQSVSGGEFRRILLARALLRDVDLLVLDEPTQGVDVMGQTALYKLLAEIRAERGCGILIVSHDLHLVMAATDRVVCLDTHICCHGAPEAVSRDPAYLRLFGERAGKELAFYAHDHAAGHDHGAAHDRAHPGHVGESDRGGP